MANKNSLDTTLTVVSSKLSAETYTIQVSFTSAFIATLPSNVVQTDPNGETYGLDAASHLQSASIPDGKSAYGTVTTTSTSFEVAYYNAAGDALLEGDDLTNAKANLTDTGSTYNIYATGDSVTRVTLTDPTSGVGTDAQKFAAAMGGAGTGTSHIGQTVVIGTVKWVASAPVFTGATFYYSVSGNTTNVVPDSGEIGSTAANNNANNGKINISIEAK